jgi:hypothetical protein
MGNGLQVQAKGTHSKERGWYKERRKHELKIKNGHREAEKAH